MRRRQFYLLAVLAVVASACGTVEHRVAAADRAAGVADDAKVELAVDVEPAAAVNDVASVGDEAAAQDSPDVVVETTTTVAPEALRTGREAILANHSAGEPYVLWYWGAH
jgi:hypothetical protein